MKCLVSVKRVIDPYVNVRFKADGSGAETQNVKMAMNPFDEIAIEEGIRLKEQGIISEVVAISIGESVCQETLRHALALGADKAILVETGNKLEPLHVAKILKAVIDKETFDLVIMGKQAIDDDNNQCGQMLAALLDWPQATFASKIEINANKAQVSREVDGGIDIIECDLPAVITTDLRLNEPRYATLPNIMKAKSKPLDTFTLDSLGVTLRDHVKVLSVDEPPVRESGIIVESVAELVSSLKDKEGVI